MQDEAVSESVARGHSASLEYASSCCDKSDVQKPNQNKSQPLKNPGENVNRNTFPVLPLHHVFICFSSQSTVCSQDWPGPNPRFLSKLGGAECYNPKAKQPLMRKGEREEAGLRHARRRSGTHFLLCCYVRTSCDASQLGLLPSQQHFPPQPPKPVPHQLLHGQDGRPGPHFVPGSCPPSGAHRGGSSHCRFLQCIAACCAKHAFMASPIAKHFGHEKYINVTTTFITVFILHLMFHYVTYTQNTFLKENAYGFIWRKGSTQNNGLCFLEIQ